MAAESAALDGFLRGVQKRARVFAHWQCGDPLAASAVLASAENRFRNEAPLRPLGDWQQLYWRTVLDVLALQGPPPAAQPQIPPGIARLAAGRRAVLLLGLVADLDDATAAAVLGMPAEACRHASRQLLPANQLGRPDLDVWRAWRAAALRAQAAAEPAPLAAVPSWLEIARAAPPVPAPPRRRGLLALLWLGVALCLAALAATFLWTPPPELEARLHGQAIRIRALPGVAAPRARMDALDALCLHPDRVRLERPALEPVAAALGFHAWFAAQPGDRAMPPLPAALADAAAVRPSADESLPACRVRMQALPARERATLEAAVAAFDALPPAARRAPRERWQAWWALSPAERAQVVQAAVRFAALPAPERATRLEAFRGLPPHAQYGWRLGPVLGGDAPALQPLLGWTDAAQREPLLAVLRAMPAEERALLGRVVSSTVVEQRPALREELLAIPAFQRGAWLRGKLEVQ